MHLTSKSDIAMRQKNEIRPCQECGQPIDPIHSCPRCSTQQWCGRHNSPFKPRTAKYCNRVCAHRASDRRQKQPNGERLT